MSRKSFNVVDYDHTKHVPNIDYSEKITEPGLVLSMREIYERYAAQGVDLLKGELVEDEQDPDDTEFFDGDDRLDGLQAVRATQMAHAGAERLSARRAAKASKKEAEKTDEKPETEEPKQSKGDEGKGDK